MFPQNIQMYMQRAWYTDGMLTPDLFLSLPFGTYKGKTFIELFMFAYFENSNAFTLLNML